MSKTRKPGRGRKSIKPDYNASALLTEQMELAVQLYESADHPSLQTIAYQMNTAMNGVSINPIKVRKLLITASFAMPYVSSDGSGYCIWESCSSLCRLC